MFLFFFNLFFYFILFIFDNVWLFEQKLKEALFSSMFVYFQILMPVICALRIYISGKQNAH